ncbi:hypothetical protein BDZ91DRAFT_210080 [Kalaharituber pfeilii]|nr:hypothetical protein BDZ91DRAFT_210080 [Kalaharituber pfeilii]
MPFFRAHYRGLLPSVLGYPIIIYFGYWHLCYLQYGPMSEVGYTELTCYSLCSMLFCRLNIRAPKTNEQANKRLFSL